VPMGKAVREERSKNDIMERPVRGKGRGIAG
jgi:hypothetical protein